MLGPIAAVAECLRASIVLTGIRPLACVRSLMYLQVFQTTEGLLTAGELKRKSTVRNQCWQIIRKAW